MPVGLQDEKFNVRLSDSNIWTQLLVTKLKKCGHIVDFRKTPEEEDKNDLVDYWFKYPGSSKYVPIAFKLRIDGKGEKRDIPVLRYQPFWGNNEAETVTGRDFRCLLEKGVQQYYVGAKNADDQFDEIYRISKEKLAPMVSSLDNHWYNVPLDVRSATLISGNDLTKERNEGMIIHKTFKGKGARKIWLTEEGEIWWQKNPKERYAKVNFYFHQSFKEDSIPVTKVDYRAMVKSFQKYKEKNK